MNRTEVTTIKGYGDSDPESSQQWLVVPATGIENNTTDSDSERRGWSLSSFCCCRNNILNDLWDKDQLLLRAMSLIVILLNVPFGQYILYPFLIFSTWIHEMCHGIAALLLGGKVLWLAIYPNGSGLAHTLLPLTCGRFGMSFFASAGYVGTAMLGGILLLFRRTKRGPRFGLYGIGSCLLLSCLFWVRTIFGLAMLLPMGLLLIMCGSCQQTSSWWIVGHMYALVAATCCLNAVTSIQVLFTTTSQEIGGTVRSSDAVAVAEQLMLPPFVWASLWLILALLMSLIGIVFVIDNDDQSSSAKGPTAVTTEDCERLQQDVCAPSIEMI
mmetsp:Transcript_4983/g.7555  ORF Transcript_4983/g.7555 Transcript_4983/m.7555 type:complete len:327 (+) Transcript_4983:106-1086(+)